MTAKNVAAIYPLSPQQQGMLFDTLQLSAPGVHIEQKIYYLRGELDVAALEHAWRYLVERHSILRTAFVWKNQDEPLQCVLREVNLEFVKHDWRTRSEAEQDERLQNFLDDDRRRGFELTKPPLMRLTLFQLGDQDYQLVWTHHHIVLDGWCRPIIDEEVRNLYETFRKGEVPRLPPARPYRDYIAWLKRQNLAGAESFWRGALSGISEPTPLGIETSIADDSHETGFGELRIKLPETAAASLKLLAREHRVTLNTLVQGLWALMLCRYSGASSVVFGTTVSGRPVDLDGSDAMLGLFINTLPFRVTIRGGSFWTWLSELQRHHLEMRQYEFCSTGQIHQWCKFPGLLPLYESILVFENYPPDTGANHPRSILSEAHHYSVGAQTRYPINILVLTRPGLELVVVFDRARFVESTVPKLRDHFLALCDAVVANPEQELTTLVQQIPADAPRLRPRALSSRDYEAPRTAGEERLTQIWIEVLGIERIGRNDDFFALKGHSLLATQILSRIRDVFDVQLPLRCLFEAPTIATLAERIALVRGEAASDAIPLLRVPRERPLPLSYAQQRLWFLSQLEPESPSYNIPSAIRLSGVLDLNALQQALNALVARHETLRTVFQIVDDEPVQVVLSEQSCELEDVDLTLTERENEAMHLITAAAARPFDLSNEPAFRALLAKLSEQDHILLLNIHHIVSDGWSMAILFRELGLLYQSVSLPELPVQYADYAVWQKDWLQGKRLDDLLAYWKNHLAGAPTVLELPLDRPRPAVQGSRGEKVSFVLPAELSDRLQSSSRREGVTSFMTLLAAFQVLLARMTQRDDVVVGTDLANRTRVETEGLIGFFVNLLPVRTRLSGELTFGELLQRVREVMLEAYAHQELPFEKLVEELKPPRDLSRNPLVQVLFVMQNTPRPVFELPGVKVNWLDLGTETSRFDVVLFVSENEGQIKGTWVYNAELFERATIEHLSTQFERLLDQVVSDPSVRVASLSIDVAKGREESMATEKPVRRARRKAVNLGELSQVKTRLLFDDQSLPLLIEPEREDVDLAEWATTNTEFVNTNLLQYGALLFRSFDVPAVPDFERFAQTLCPALYGEYGDLPREEMGGKVYGSTPYPADETILFHNESSHMHRWPMLIWFYCVKPSEVGGETPIVDCRKIYQALDPELRRMFAERGLMYVRNFTPGLDVSWQHFFHTGERAVVEDYCRQAGIEFEWRSDGGLRTRQICPAIVKHPQTGEMVFFNQLQLHHVSCLAAPVRESLLSMMPEEDFPRNVYYGDGTRIEDEVMDELLSLYRQCAVTFAWRQHDIIMLNNMLVAHSRNPYVGERKIVVALGNIVSKLDRIARFAK